MKSTVAVVFAAGCFSPPTLYLGDGSTDGDGDTPACSAAQPSAAGIVLSGGSEPVFTFPTNVALGFPSDAARYPMPNRLDVGGIPVIGGTFTSSCGPEHLMGITAFPAYMVTAHTGLAGSNVHALARDLVGPAYTELATRWELSITPELCGWAGTGLGVASGSTTWGLFPDGRIVRTDQFTSSSEALSGGTIFVTSFIGFNRAVVDTLIPMGTPESDVIALGTNGQSSMCAAAPGAPPARSRIALLWERNGAPSSQLRLRDDDAPNPVLAVVNDLQMANTIPAASEYTLRTTLLTSTEHDCDALFDRVSNLIAAPRLAIDGEPMGITYNERGYFTFGDRTAPITISPFSGTILGAFTVRVRFPGFEGISTSAPDGRVVWQRDGDDFFITVLDDLPTQQSITITPQCPASS